MVTCGWVGIIRDDRSLFLFWSVPVAKVVQRIFPRLHFHALSVLHNAAVTTRLLYLIIIRMRLLLVVTPLRRDVGGGVGREDGFLALAPFAVPSGVGAGIVCR